MSPEPPIPELIKLLRNDSQSALKNGHKEVFIARAPGRLDVMGGIADYAGSLVCELPLESGAAVAIQRRDDRKIRIKTYSSASAAGGGPDSGEKEAAVQDTVELSLDDFYGTAALLPIETIQAMFTGPRHWAGYVAGAFPILAKHKKITRRTHGANICCYTDLPLGAGSSAALECAALWALTAAYHLILEPLEIAVAAQKIENHIVGAPCGIMDPVTSMLGKKDHLLLLNCQPHEIKGYLPVPRGYLLAGIHSNVWHAREGYRQTRIAAFIALAMISRMYRDLGMKKDPTAGYLANVAPDLYLRYFRTMLPEKIQGKAFLDAYGATADRVTAVDPAGTYHPRAAADHHIHESARIKAFVGHLEALGTGAGKEHLQQAGQLMLESHESYSKNAQLGCPETDLLVELIMMRGTARGFYGARITGGGAGGTVALLAEDSDPVRRELEQISAEYQSRTGLQPRIFTASSPGAAEITPLKIPLAELGG